MGEKRDLNEIKGSWEHDDKENDKQSGVNTTESASFEDVTNSSGNTREWSSRHFR
jgi:hypothetical protein